MNYLKFEESIFFLQLITVIKMGSIDELPKVYRKWWDENKPTFLPRDIEHFYQTSEGTLTITDLILQNNKFLIETFNNSENIEDPKYLRVQRLIKLKQLDEL